MNRFPAAGAIPPWRKTLLGKIGRRERQVVIGRKCPKNRNADASAEFVAIGKIGRKNSGFRVTLGSGAEKNGT